MDSNVLIEGTFRLAPPQKAALKKLGVKTVADLLYHFPVRYGDTSEMRSIAGLQSGDSAVVFGKISGLKMGKGFKTKISMADGWVEDGTGKIKAVWFNQPYLAKMVAEGAFVRVEGKVSERKKNGELYFSNPKIETVNKLPIGVGDSLFGAEGEKHTLYPVYPESRGITSNWLYHAIGKIFKSGILENFPDPIPHDILTRYNLPSIKTALVWIHTPQKAADAAAARKRFAFEEVFLIQLEKQRAKKEWQKNKSFVIEKPPEEIAKFTSRFPFSATNAQTRAVETILADFKKGHAMSRLLEGDVGSGKTAVAATTVFAVTTSRPAGQNFGNLQTAYMCPTEILATQHFESFIKYFSHLPIQVALITGSGCRKFPSKVNPDGWTDISRNQLLKWVANGEIPILIGTHALIQKSVKFKNLAYVIIDEQHRFGTAQRQKLVRKNNIAPHLLSMTATPIPRTLALTVYGDLDLTLLDEMPVGRKPIITEIVLPNRREETYEKIRTELKAGRQAYVICPRIDVPDPDKEAAVIAKSVKEEAERLKKSIFPEYEIGILHSKMTPGAKDESMAEFKSGHVHILCATSVVEVGVNVPNATVIIIEGAERFGLAQLHQLRGRVIRSNHQAYCYVFAETKTEKTLNRLKALQTAKNGFELAEYDLKFRGAGELGGSKQWGVSDIAMEALQNLKMVEAARLEAARLISEDETLSRYPVLASAVKTRGGEIHFE
ncbi:MAG: ATP-dependent DNA helicase RecG [bacterium]|nr:ATP-dependent DNA helicase RecG [bacterium]